jgi:hypothetical protein
VILEELAAIPAKTMNRIATPAELAAGIRASVNRKTVD